MHVTLSSKVIAALYFLLLFGCKVSAQQPANCIHIFYCLFDQKAAATDSAGIHQYSRNVADLILPNAWTYGRSPSGRMESFEDEFLGEKYAAKLADRLAGAEQATRSGKGRRVAESEVARAFNELMKEVGAPPSVRSDEMSLHKFRAHAAEIKAFTALLSADRNGTNCNPGEAVFLLGLLIMDNGVLYERNLDDELALMYPQPLRNDVRQMAFAVAKNAIEPDSKRLVSSYLADHGRHAGRSLFNHLFEILGF